MDASFKLTRQEIGAAYDAGRDAVIALIEALIERYEQRITALEQELQELKKDSHDSGKPPSRDSFERKQHSRTASRRQRTGKRHGGQPNHPGATLSQSEHPDLVTVHAVDRCGCGRSLADEPVADYERRQVFEVPPLAAQVTEHRAERKRCPDCGKTAVATFPEPVRQPVQYGERLQAVAAYLKNYGLLPYQRTAEWFADLFSIPISVGTLVHINATCAERLEGVSEMIRAAIGGQPVVGFDETGMSVDGHLRWLHVASTEALTHYAEHAKRGKQAGDDIGILTDFAGIALHDHWQSYFRYQCGHALCNAHHLRELTFVEEQYRQPWAGELKELLLTMNAAVDRARQEGRPRLYRPERRRFAAEYRRIINAGLAANPPPPPTPPGTPKKRGRKKQSKPRNLLLRLAGRWRSVLAFMYDLRVPFTNNQAERDLRMTRSYISTIRKNGGNVLDALTTVFENRPMIPTCLKPSAPAE